MEASRLDKSSAKIYSRVKILGRGILDFSIEEYGIVAKGLARVEEYFIK